MAYLTNDSSVDKKSTIHSSISPADLLDLFKEQVDFSKQPRKPFGTMSLTPYQRVWKVVGTIDPSESVMRLRYDSELDEGKTILAVAINKGEKDGSVVSLSFERAGLNQQEKFGIIGAAVLFWGLLLFMIGMVHQLVPTSEVQKIWVSGFLVTLVTVIALPLASMFRYERDKGPISKFAHDLIKDAELKRSTQDSFLSN